MTDGRGRGDRTRNAVCVTPPPGRAPEGDDHAHEHAHIDAGLKRGPHHFLWRNQVQLTVADRHERRGSHHDGVHEEEDERSSADPELEQVARAHEPPCGPP